MKPQNETPEGTPHAAAHDSADTYTCAECGGVFERGWTDEEALAELHDKFGVRQEECDVVCDDCYKAMGYA